MSADIEAVPVVAATIFAQLGANRFRAMTGASLFVGSPGFLRFRIPAAKQGINSVTVTLNSNDLYDVEFAHVAGVRVRVVVTHTDVYVDRLQEVFTAETGLDTHL